MTKKQKKINNVIDKFIGKKGILIPLLQEIQDIEKYLSKETMRFVTEKTGIKLAEIYGVATFYSQFRFNPPGRHSIKICLGTACHVQGGDFILKALQAEIGISPGETTDDMRFDLERVACLGCCALAPVVMIDNKIHSRMSVIKLKELLNKYE